MNGGQQSPSPPRAAVDTGPVNQPPRAPFSGEIVYRMTAIARSSGAARDLGELHYFISGPHWKHVDEQGDKEGRVRP